MGESTQTENVMRKVGGLEPLPRDSQGRVTVPAKMRERIGDSFVLEEGRNGGIWIWPTHVWEKKNADIYELDDDNPHKDNLLFLLNASVVLDCSWEGTSGRLKLPKSMEARAGLTVGPLCVVGEGERLAIRTQAQVDELLQSEDKTKTRAQLIAEQKKLAKEWRA